MNKELQDELESLLPGKSGRLPHGGQPQPPEGYFDDLERRVLQRVRAAEERVVVHRPRPRSEGPWFLRMTHPAWAAAAALLLVAFFAYRQWGVDRGSSTVETDEWAAIDQAALHAYLEHHAEDFELTLLLRTLYEDGAEPELFEDLDTETLEDYLDEDLM